MIKMGAEDKIEWEGDLENVTLGNRNSLEYMKKKYRSTKYNRDCL